MRLSAAQHAAFKRAIETGKWANGEPVAQAQRELMLQAVILYEQANPVPGPLTGVLDDQCAARTPATSTRSETAAQPAGEELIARQREY
ncbi:MAG: DUF1315 family protein [Pseudomonadales bacterium]|nr:DUF1315 family protein [Pseudomonadales bacterium]